VLFCAFVGAIHGAILSEQTIEEAMDAVSAWHRPVVSTLREARRALKLLINTQPPIGSDIASLRTKVKALELEAERVEQNMLEHWLNSKVGLLPRAEPRTARDRRRCRKTLSPQRSRSEPVAIGQTETLRDISLSGADKLQRKAVAGA
jgi:uncharacterized protein (TIGR02444 family)